MSRSYIGGIIGADPLPSGSLRPGVSNLGELGGDGVSTTRPTRRWGGVIGRSLVGTEAPVIDHSLRFDGTADYLGWSPTTDGDMKKWTWSGWVKRHVTGTFTPIFGAASSTSAPYFYFGFSSTSGEVDTLRMDQVVSGPTVQIRIKSQEAFDSTDTWYHIIVSYDAANTTEADRVKWWVNGQSVDTDETNGRVYPSSTQDTLWNDASHTMYLGRNHSAYGKISLAEVHFLDGYALQETSPSVTVDTFGETRDGVWVPKEVTGLTYGNNGFYLPFDRNGEGVTLLLDGTSTTSDVANSQVFDTVSNVTAQSTGGPNNNGPVIDFGSSSTTGHMLDNNPTSLPEGTEDFTVEFWFRQDYVSNSVSRSLFLSLNGTADRQIDIFLAGNNKVAYYHTSSTKITGTTTINYQQWYHIAAVRKNGTTTLYVDGVSQGSFSDTGSYTAGTRLGLGGFYTGTSWATGTGYSLQGQMTGIRITRGIARDIASGFSGGTPVTGGGWDVALTNDIQYGSLGRDATTNSNNFTVPTNTLTPDDQLIDTPNLRFATWDTATPPSGTTLSNGNLTVTHGTTLSYGNPKSTLSMSNGKYYFECHLDAATDATNYGMMVQVADTGNDWLSGFYTSSGAAWTGVTSSTYGTGNMSVGGIVGVALNADTGTTWFSVNGVWQNGATSSGIADGTDTNYAHTLLTGPFYFAVDDASGSNRGIVTTANFGQDHTFAGAKSTLLTPYSDANGVGEFYYQPPSGFLALADNYVVTDSLATTGVLSVSEMLQASL